MKAVVMLALVMAASILPTTAREKPTPVPTVGTDLYIVNGNGELAVHGVSKNCQQSGPKLQCSGDGFVDFRFRDNYDEGCQLKFWRKGPHWDAHAQEWHTGSLRYWKTFACVQHWRNGNTYYISGLRLKPPYPTRYGN